MGHECDLTVEGPITEVDGGVVIRVLDLHVL
jgi:hypothetical protein